MIIKSICIQNFRNLDGLKIDFHNKINFIVGKNNIGKTNVLDLFRTIFNRRDFDEADFTDLNKPIEIELRIKITDEEIGVFDDYFSRANNPNLIHIIFKQKTIDDNIRYYEKTTGDELFRNHIRNAHFISYGSVRNPDRELSFDPRGRNFLSLIIDKYIVENGKPDFLSQERMNDLIKSINCHVKKIKTFDLFELKAGTDHDMTSLLGRLIQLQTDENFKIKELGEGAKFLNSIPLVLLDQISRIIERTDENTVFNEDGERVLNVIIAIDEPELHLHPHSQRFFIHYLREILSGENQEFNELLKHIYDIDYIQGQLIIVTHSPFILLNDHRYIIRIYKEKDSVEVCCGKKVIVPGEQKKHLYRFFDELKEAFFARKILVIEGETELGAFTSYLQDGGSDAAVKSISVIDAGGIHTVPHLINLFSQFGIPTYGLIDRDDGNLEREKFNDTSNLFQTDLREFENEIVENLSLDRYLDYLVFRNLDVVTMTAVKVKNHCPEINHSCQEEYVNTLRELDESVKNKILEDLKERIINHLKTEKGFLTGSIIIEYVEQMPNSFKNVLDKLENN